MNYTTRFRLLKPEVNDYYSIDDFNANADIIDAALSNDGRTVIAQRERDPTLPSYGMDASVVLRAAPYTGAAEITLQVEQQLYDAENMSARPQESLNGTIIIKKLED